MIALALQAAGALLAAIFLVNLFREKKTNRFLVLAW